MKTIDDALELRRRIFGAFEIAEMTHDQTERQRWLTVAIVGAGRPGWSSPARFGSWRHAALRVPLL
jgi:NADH:ubiquinone reductase (H+-translocating)